MNFFYQRSLVNIFVGVSLVGGFYFLNKHYGLLNHLPTGLILRELTGGIDSEEDSDEDTNESISNSEDDEEIDTLSANIDKDTEEIDNLSVNINNRDKPEEDDDKKI